jgi:LacI family transcriptional regulator
MATIRDVALKAGVSVATVSHVMNESRYVAPETKERVLAAIAELRYRRDGIARSLRRSKTGTIGVVISDITNPYFSDLVRGIEDSVYGLDDKMNFILCNTEEDLAKERLYLDVLMEKRVDGVIVAPAGGNEAHFAELAEILPTVFVDRSLAGVEADSVLVDNEAAARGLVEHLIRLGHRRIAILKATLRADSIENRVAGYRKALAAAGIPYDPALLFESPSTIEAAFEAGGRIVGAKPLPDAVFCTNNFMTLGMMRALHENGLRCPEDVAVAGFDDFPWADSFYPRLTAVAQPSYAIGQEAVRLLFDRMSKRRVGRGVTLTLSTSLMVRDSCGAGLKRRPAAASAGG